LAILAVFFDLGGTLVVTRRERIFRRVLTEQSRKASLKSIHNAYSRTEPWWLSVYGKMVLTPGETDEAYRVLDAKVFSALFPGEGQTEADRVSRVVRRRWPDLEGEIPLKLYPDVEPTLARLSRDGLILALVSNAPADTTKVVEELGLRRYLKHVVISGVVGYTKPNPGIFRVALKQAGVHPSQTIHVGDIYESDVVGARNAGIEGILLDRDGLAAGSDCPTIRTLDEVSVFAGRDRAGTASPWGAPPS
jgi:HAD superfamily hydrolase (TIGR01549 family)